MASRPSREAVARWNRAYGEQTAALFAAMRGVPSSAQLRRLAAGYQVLADAWRVLAADLAAPLWARHAASVAAEEFERRALVELSRAALAATYEKET